MSLANDNIDELIIKYLQHTLSEREQVQLDGWIAASDDNRQLLKKLTDQNWMTTELATLEGFDEARGWQRIAESGSFAEHPSLPVTRIGWRRIAVAASVVLAIGLAGYLFFRETPPPGQPPIQITQRDITSPSVNRAMITLSNGTTISLDSVAKGQVALEGNVRLMKLEDGQITYNGNSQVALLNTLTNPRGSKVINITLGDGTKVWLNAGSSLVYPVTFTGKERSVNIRGEAYFEVTPDASMPFVVRNGNTTVEVLGTHFNVNSYEDEADIKVTLLEGKVKVVTDGAMKIIRPGQQARVNGAIQVEDDVDLDQVMAWKNGYFQFNKASLQEVMRQVSRWYDVDISYEGEIPDRQFGGKINRDASVAQLLKILEESKVNYRIEGRKIVVLK